MNNNYGMPSPFQMGQAVGSNLGEAFQKAGDMRSIDQILGQAAQSNNPADIRRAIGQILSQVQPARQKDAIAVLQKRLDQMSAKPAAPLGGLSGQPVPPEVSNAIKRVIDENPNANADELASKMDQAGIARAYSNSFVENRRRQNESTEATARTVNTENRKNVSDYTLNIMNKADAARESLIDKRNQIDLIETGNINDPTVVTAATNIFGQFADRFLSDDTIKYRGGLINNYKDLRTVFSGPTRVKEIELLEEKVPGLHLSDSQKLGLLNAQIPLLNKDILMEDAVGIVLDNPNNQNLSPYEFRKKVRTAFDELSKNAFDTFISESNRILDEAKESNKTLSMSNPSDAKIVREIYMEAGQDQDKAKKLAAKRGITITR
jgi:hypothetical protein